jgi:hypothetical protein
VMVQPYLAAIEDAGETALVYLRGIFSHAVRKGAVLMGPDRGIDRRFQPQGGLNPEVCRPTAAQFTMAERVLAAVPAGRDTLLYARVDLIPSEDGSPTLMELELTEPPSFRPPPRRCRPNGRCRRRPSACTQIGSRDWNPQTTTVSGFNAERRRDTS